MFLNKAGITISPTTESLHFLKNYKLSFDFDFEHYLNVLPNKLRVSLVRLSSHQLRIKTGRYSQNRVDSFVCFFCVEVLRPSQLNGVMSSAVSLPNHTFTGQA